jgi:hypothetical protein
MYNDEQLQEKRIKKVNDCLSSYVKHASKAAPLRDFITPRVPLNSLLPHMFALAQTSLLTPLLLSVLL